MFNKISYQICKGFQKGYILFIFLLPITRLRHNWILECQIINNGKSNKMKTCNHLQRKACTWRPHHKITQMWFSLQNAGRVFHRLQVLIANIAADCVRCKSWKISISADTIFVQRRKTPKAIIHNGALGISPPTMDAAFYSPDVYGKQWQHSQMEQLNDIWCGKNDNT